MKSLYKIIGLFIFIFITGIFITVLTVNTSLNKADAPKKTLEIKKDTTYLLKTEKRRV